MINLERNLQNITIRLASQADLASLMHLKTEVDFALKGAIWSEAYHQSLQDYFDNLFNQGQIIIATLEPCANKDYLQENKIDLSSQHLLELPHNLPKFIATSQPLILGAALVQYVSSGQEAHLYLSKLYVRPAFRNQGIATQILKFAAASTLDFNCHALSLDTNPTLNNALHLYLKHGFTIATPPAQLHLAPHELYLVRHNSLQL